MLNVKLTIEFAGTTVELKVQAANAGALPQDSPTEPLKPGPAATVTVNLTELPAITEAPDEGLIKSEKGGGTIVMLAVAVRVVEPLAPVTVKLAGPAGVLVLVLKVRLTEEFGCAGFVLKVQAAPAGRPLQDNATGLLKFPVPLTVTVNGTELPAVTEAPDEGLMLSENSGTATMDAGPPARLATRKQAAAKTRALARRAMNPFTRNPLWGRSRSIYWHRGPVNPTPTLAVS